MIAKDPFLELGHKNVDTILHPIIYQGSIPSRLPLAGIALAIVLNHELAVGQLIVARYCKEICEQGDEITAYMRGMKEKQWAKLVGIESERFFYIVDKKIEGFPQLQEVAHIFYDAFLSFTPYDSIITVFKTSKSERLHHNEFISRIMNGMSHYSQDFIDAFNKRFSEKSEEIGFSPEAKNYGPIGPTGMAFLLVRDIIARVIKEMDQNTSLQTIGALVHELSKPLIPAFICTDNGETVESVMWPVRDALMDCDSGFELIKIIKTYSIAVSDLSVWVLQASIKLYKDKRKNDAAQKCSIILGKLMRFRNALINTTPNYNDAPQRINAIYEAVQEMAGDISKDRYYELAKEFPETQTLV